MKIFRAIAAVACFAAGASPIFAQTRPAGQPAQRPAPQPTAPSPQTSGVVIPDARIALIDSQAFFDEKQGITRLVNAIKRVDKEFEPTQTQLQQLQQQEQKAEDDLKKALPLQDAKVSQQQSDKIDEMKKKLQRDTEDAQARYQKRIQEVLAPIQEDISKALDTYAKARNISLLLDGAKLGQAIIMASDALDITRAFIIEFNSKNPATASLGPQ